MGVYDRLGDLEVAVEGMSFERRELAVGSGFTRVTTTAVLEGGGLRGEGEDVTYTAADHDDFPADLDLRGVRSLRELSALLDTKTLFSHEPEQHAAHEYRRWAFESAGLDLALRQAGLSLADALGSHPAPVRFVVSTRARIDGWLEADPSLEFKLDPE